MDIGKEMKKIMKEATIEFLRSLDADKAKINNVINFLQRGWKYEEILEEFIKEWGEYRIVSPTERSYTSPKICWALDELKQKYFPKVIK